MCAYSPQLTWLAEGEPSSHWDLQPDILSGPAQLKAGDFSRAKLSGDKQTNKLIASFDRERLAMKRQMGALAGGKRENSVLQVTSPRRAASAAVTPPQKGFYSSGFSSA